MTNATQWSIQSDCICLPNGRAILNVDAIGGETEAEVKANIAVIAAAPETLQWLIVAEDMLKQCMQQTEFTLGACKNMRAIRAAIANATGK